MNVTESHGSLVNLLLDFIVVLLAAVYQVDALGLVETVVLPVTLAGIALCE